MSVNVTLPLFGGPGHEIEEGAPVNGQQLRELGTQLNERLQKAAETADKLRAAGWTVRVALFDLVLAHPAVLTEELAKLYLFRLGLDLDQFVILEELEPEDDGE